MTLTLADNPAITPELAKQALAKCKIFFLGLTFTGSRFTHDTDEEEREYTETQKSHQASLKKHDVELEVQLRPPHKLEFFIKMGNDSVMFFPEYSDLGKSFTRELSKILEDDEIAALYLMGAKNREKSGGERLLELMSSNKLNEIDEGLDDFFRELGVNTIGGVKREEAAHNWVDSARTNLRYIEALTSEKVRQLLSK